MYEVKENIIFGFIFWCTKVSRFQKKLVNRKKTPKFSGFETKICASCERNHIKRKAMMKSPSSDVAVLNKGFLVFPIKSGDFVTHTQGGVNPINFKIGKIFAWGF